MNFPGRRLRSLATGRWRWVAGTVLVVLVLLLLGRYAAGEPLRRYIQHEMNRKLTGYTVSIGALRFHLIGGIAWYLDDVVVRQKANPDPPVSRIPTLSAAMSWWALLHGRLVSDFALYDPVLFLNRRQVLTESRDNVPVLKRGWQAALQAAHPFDINEFRVVNGDVTYVDVDQAKPLRVQRLTVDAHDIRNVHSAPGTYPSPVRAEAVVFDTGKLAIDGAADFLAEPFAAVKGHLELDNIALDYFKPVLAHYNVTLRSGWLSGVGDIEYSPKVRRVELDHVVLDHFDGTYTHKRNAEEATTKQVAQTVAQTAQRVTNQPGTLVKVHELSASRSTVGFVHTEARPQFRVFMTDTDLTATNLSNQQSEGEAAATLHGRFMGSGAVTATARFLPRTNGPHFDVSLKIVDTDLTKLNDVLRAHDKIDVAAGLFSLYSELAAKDGRVAGYVKPLFRELKVYEKDKDRGKPARTKLKERAIDLTAKVLKNRARKEVATEVRIEGPLRNPKASTLEVLVNLFRNAFVRAILPGFDREIHDAVG